MNEGLSGSARQQLRLITPFLIRLSGWSVRTSAKAQREILPAKLLAAVSSKHLVKRSASVRIPRDALLLSRFKQSQRLLSEI